MSKINSFKEILTISCEENKDKIAFKEKNKEINEFENITYAKFREDVIALGTYITEELKFKKEKIAVMGENSYRWVVTYLATTIGNNIIVPLDKELPGNEIVNLIQRSGTKCIVYSSKKKEIISSIMNELPKDMVFIEMNRKEDEGKILAFNKVLEYGKEIANKNNNKFLDINVDVNEFNILLFTSGTTSSSKGVMLCQKNITSNVMDMVDIFKDESKGVFFSILPIHHTYEFSTTYMLALMNGGTIGICEGLKYIAPNLQEIQPTTILAVPQLVENVLNKIEKGIRDGKKTLLVNTMVKISNFLRIFGIDLRLKLFKQMHKSLGGKVKYIVSGAAPVDKKVLKRLEDFGFNVLQGYGLTETSPLVSVTWVTEKKQLGTVGKPVKQVRVKISDQGEVLVKGPNVMLGYYENKEETDKVLNDGWFSTGDSGFIDKRGNIVLSGRIKNVIVTANGKNIFPEEIERYISRIPLIKECMVYGKGDRNDLTISAKVTLNEEYIKENYENRPTDSEIHEEIWTAIKKINRQMVSYKAVKNLEIKKDDFEKTTTMKIKRYLELLKK